jgi:hypothetical protein
MPGPLDYLHERPTIVENSDWYFGEFLLSPVGACKRWLGELQTRLLRPRRDASFFHRTSNRLRQVNIKAATGYHPQPYPGKISIVMCSDGPSRAYEDRRLGWSAVADGGLEVHIAPGNHETMEQEPNIQVLGGHFRRCLDAAEPSPRRTDTPPLSRAPSAAPHNHSAPEMSDQIRLPGICSRA